MPPWQVCNLHSILSEHRSMFCLHHHITSSQKYQFNEAFESTRVNIFLNQTLTKEYVDKVLKLRGGQENCVNVSKVYFTSCLTIVTIIILISNIWRQLQQFTNIIRSAVERKNYSWGWISHHVFGLILWTFFLTQANSQ